MWVLTVEETDIHLQFYISPFTLLILQIWSMRRTVRRQVMQCVRVLRATDAETVNVRSVRKFRQLLFLLLLLLKQYHPTMVSVLTRCCQSVKWIAVEGKQTITHRVYQVYSLLTCLLFLSPFLHPFAPFLSTSSRYNVDLGESVLRVCVCVRSAHLFPSHQQTYTTMWMDLANIIRSVLL